MNREADQSNPQEDIELRMRTLRILWFAFFVSILLYYMVTIFIGRNEDVAPNNTLSLALIIAAFSTTLVSFLIKNRLLTRAVEQQHVGMVQQAYIVTWAINEVAALLGLLDFFATGNRYFYVLFLLAAAGQLLHYPRREHVENAAFKPATF
jgi:bacteriorhodopsin